MGTQLPSPKKGQSHQFLAPVYCGQTAGWIGSRYVALGMEVGLGPGHIVLDGDTAPLPQKGTEPPIFGPCILWPNGWMEDATWYGSRPRPRPLCIRQVPSYRRKRHSSPPLFGPCLLWQRSPISATAELLFNFVAAVQWLDRLRYVTREVSPAKL